MFPRRLLSFFLLLSALLCFAACGSEIADQTPPAETLPVESAPAESTPMESAPAETTSPPVSDPVESTPSESLPAESDPDESESVEPMSGMLNDTIFWSFEDGTLTLSGTDIAYCFSAPWHEFIPDIETLVIEEGITVIGDSLFANCTALTTVFLPESMDVIGSNAFYGCTSLTSIPLPSRLSHLYDNAFRGCTALTSITLPNSLVELGSYVFTDCSSLTEVSVGPSLNEIGCHPFRNTPWQNSQPDGFVILNGHLIDYAGPGGDIILPSHITMIEDFAFEYSAITSVVIPEGLTTIDMDAFCSCLELTSVTIPSTVTEIGAFSFWNCTALTSIHIPDNVTKIGHSAFSLCVSLTEVTGGNGLISVGHEAFLSTPWLDSKTDDFVTLGSCLIAYNGAGGSIVIPDGITSISEFTFYENQSIISVTIPDSVTSIQNCAFCGCLALGEVLGCRGVTHIGYQAFSRTLWYASRPDDFSIINGILIDYVGVPREVTVPDGVTALNSYVFELRNVTSVTLPDSVTTILPFAFQGCSKLTTLYLPDSITSIGENAFWGCSDELNIYYNGTEEQWNAIQGLADSKLPESVSLHLLTK